MPSSTSVTRPILISPLHMDIWRKVVNLTMCTSFNIIYSLYLTINTCCFYDPESDVYCTYKQNNLHVCVMPSFNCRECREKWDTNREKKNSGHIRLALLSIPDPFSWHIVLHSSPFRDRRECLEPFETFVSVPRTEKIAEYSNMKEGELTTMRDKYDPKYFFLYWYLITLYIHDSGNGV